MKPVLENRKKMPHPNVQGPPENLPRCIYPISSIDQTLVYDCVELLDEKCNIRQNITRSVNIKITLQTGSPDHREIN